VFYYCNNEDGAVLRSIALSTQLDMHNHLSESSFSCLSLQPGKHATRRSSDITSLESGIVFFVFVSNRDAGDSGDAGGSRDAGASGVATSVVLVEQSSPVNPTLHAHFPFSQTPTLLQLFKQ
tara:strand:+ start:276 stop:641 length:366 start_codon:yes stop_codon:yes gene_type:complete